MNSVLIIYEQQKNCTHIIEVLKDYGYQVHETRGSLQGIDILRNNKNFCFVILDGGLEDIDGVSFIKQLRNFDICIPLVYLAKDSQALPKIEAALQAGATDFLFQNDSRLRIAVMIKALKFYTPLKEEIEFRSRIKGKRIFSTLVSHSDAMRVCVKAAKNAAKSNKNIYLRGEKGTGREDLARAIHQNSVFSSGNFVILQCLDYFALRYKNSIFDEAVLTDDCIESDRKDFYDNVFYNALEEQTPDHDNIKAYSNAKEQPLLRLTNYVEKSQIMQINDWQSYAKKQVDFAHKGTLCLLGFDALTAEQQKILENLLDVHREKKKKNFRIIVLANMSAEELVRERNFSLALVQKLAEIKIFVPPLRQRREDLPELAKNIIREIALEIGRLHHIQGLSGATIVSLMQQSWSGNIPQLENTLYRAGLFSSGPLITLKDLAYVTAQPSWGSNPMGKGQDEPMNNLSYLDENGHTKTLADVEKELIELALKRYHYRMSEVARRLEIGRSTLYRKIEEYSSKLKKTLGKID